MERLQQHPYSMWRAHKAEMPDLWGYTPEAARMDNATEAVFTVTQSNVGKKFKPPKVPRPRKKEKPISLAEALEANRKKKELEA